MKIITPEQQDEQEFALAYIPQDVDDLLSQGLALFRQHGCRLGTAPGRGIPRAMRFKDQHEIKVMKAGGRILHQAFTVGRLLQGMTQWLDELN